MKILDYIKKNGIYISFTIIFLLAFFLRLLLINRPEGLWYDELISFNEISKSSLFAVIIATIKADIHFPLYNTFLYLWAKIFSTSDVMLRFLSVIFGISTVIISFFIGKKLKNNRLGIILMLIFSINSYLIYYSQEVKLYSLLYLLLSINTLYLVKILKNSSKLKDFILFSIFSFLILITYTSGLFFVLAEFIILFLHFYFYKKEDIKKFNISLVLLFVLNIPTLMIYLYNFDKFKGFFTSAYSDLSSIFVALQNYLTPVFFAVATNPPHYVKSLMQNLSLHNFVFIIIPLIISFYFLFKNICTKEDFSTISNSIIVSFLILAIIAFELTNFPLLSRYLSLILPLLLTCIALGVEKSFDKKTTKILFIFLILINLSYLMFSSKAVYKISRCGYKPLANFVNEYSSTGDVLLLWNNPNILDKYLNKDLQKLAILKNFAYTSDLILYNENKLNKMKLEQRKDFLRSDLKKKEIPNNTVLLLNTIKTHFKNKNLILTTTKNFDNYDRNDFINLLNNDEKFAEIPYNSLLTIYAIINIKDYCNQNFKLIKQKQDAYFVIYVYKM